MSIKALFILWNESGLCLRRRSSPSGTASFVCWAFLRVWPAKSVFMCSNTRFLWKDDCPKVSLLNRSRTHFVPCHGNLYCRFWTTDTISSHPSPNTWTMWLWISARWIFLVLKSHITNCASEEVGFSIFVLVCNEDNSWHCTTQGPCSTWTTGTTSARGRYLPSVLTIWLRLLCLGYTSVCCLSQSSILFTDSLIRWV